MEVKPNLDESARKIHTSILQALANASQKRVADALGIHESSVSRMKSTDGDIENMARLLAVLGLKVVAVDVLTYKPEMINALHTLARAGLDLSPEFAVLKDKE